MQIPFVGPTYSLANRRASVQRTVNMYPVPIEPGNERTAYTFKDASGLELFVDTGAEIRGMASARGALHAVSGGSLLKIAADATFTNLGSLPTATGRVDFAENTTQLAITDGSNLAVNVLGATGVAAVPGYPGGDRLAFLDQYILFNHPNSQRFGWTELADATSLDALNFASAEGSPDKLISVIVEHREAMLLGENSCEFWASTGSNAVFERNNSAFVEFGCVSPFSAQKVANSVIWLSREDRGQGIVMQATGYQPQRVSTEAIEELLQDKDISGAYAFTFSEGSSMFYCLQVPGLSSTLVYDAAYRQWHERAELVDGDYQPWRATSHAFAYGRHYFGSADGKIYRSRPNYFRYGADNICRDRISPVLSAPSRKLLRFPSVEAVLETATSANIMLRWSDDNGATWSDWVQRNSGAVGEYGQRVRWLRTGTGRDRVFQMRCTDNAPFNPVLVEVDMA